MMRQLRLLVGLLISAALIWLLVRDLSLAELLAQLRAANYGLVIPAILIYFAGVWVRAARWRLFLSPVAAFSTGRLFAATIVGFTINNLLPVRLGEFGRALLLHRWSGVSPAATLGTIVVERLFDGLTLCAIIGLAWPWLPADSWLRAAALLGSLAFAAATLLAVLGAAWPDRLLALARLGSRRLPPAARERVVGLCLAFLAGLRILRQGRVLAGALLLSFVAWLSEATMYHLIMLGFGVSAGPFAALLGMAAANLGTMVPSSPGFIGTFDLPLQSVLSGLFAVEPSLATSITLVIHTALLVPVTALGLVLLWREGLSLVELGQPGDPSQSVATPADSTARAL